MNRWAEHVDELLNRPLPPIPPYIERAISDFHIDCEKPAREEKKESHQIDDEKEGRWQLTSIHRAIRFRGIGGNAKSPL